jgi:phosphatidate cytidylyltransferase
MKRILTAAALVPPVVYVVLAGPVWLLLAVVALVAALSYYEFEALAARGGVGGFGPLGYGAGLLLLLPSSEGLLAAVLCVLLALVLAMRAADLAHALPRAALFALGLVYIFGCWKFAIPLHASSPHILMCVLLVNWAGDTGAYYVGRAFGRHRMAPRVSPKKSWEGAAASLVVAIASGTAYLMYFLPAMSVVYMVLIAAAANIAGQVGDLAESAIKRGVGVKDSGGILPGHGGFLDRVDGTLFALPAVYLLVRILG